MQTPPTHHDTDQGLCVLPPIDLSSVFMHIVVFQLEMGERRLLQTGVMYD